LLKRVRARQPGAMVNDFLTNHIRTAARLGWERDD
jgi:hypothetical protein